MTEIDATTPEAYGEVVERLSGEPVRGSRGGDMRELLGVTIRSPDPRERHLFRGKYNLAFQLQEHWAYWAGANPGHVQRYNSNMRTWIDETGEMPGSAYGDRLRNTAGHDQIERAVSQIRENPDTRRALMAVHQPAVEDYDSNDVACTAHLQAFARDGELHMHAAVRSQDMFWGYPYDAANNQYIQETMAGLLGLDVGEYVHTMGSCHYYTEYEDDALAAAENGEAVSVPDHRLCEHDHDMVWEALTDGCEKTREGLDPARQVNELDGLSAYHADWLRVVAAYELHRHHELDEGVGRRLRAGIQNDAWRDWAMGWA